MSEFRETPQPLERTIDLKGGKSFGPFEFSGEPIDVKMSDQLFQIIKADSQLFNTRYLLVDPKTFDPKYPQTGYKGLWDGQEIRFGRHYPYRFVYASDVSREHLKIIVRGDKITIADLNSTNGTTVIIREGKKAGYAIREELSVKPLERLELGRIFERAGKRNAEEVLALVSKVEQILAQEGKQGTGKLGRNIQETRDGRSGNEYFVDGKIAYLPPRGKAVFIGDTHGDSLSTEAIVRQVKFVEEMERGSKDFYLVFLGDYADRGSNDVRNLEMVLELKTRYPQNVILMMGNHEEGGGFSPYELPNSLRRSFGIVSDNVHEAYTRLFRKLPNVLVAGNGIVALHGGIPKEDFRDLQTLRNNEALFRQIRWNDPSSHVQEFEPNRRGGGTYEFGQKPFERFISRLGARVMIRSHEYPADGYELLFGNRLVTIFSNGGRSRESHYQNRVNPKFMTISLNEQISRIDPSRQIVDIKF